MQKVLVGLRGAATCRDTAIPLRRRLRVRVPSLPRPTRTHRRTGHIGYTFSFFRGSDAVQGVFGDGRMAAWPSLPRSEEHTSELQSRFDLVCRLLLEKKNTPRRAT